MVGLIRKARNLRQEQTPVEGRLWQRLRAKRLDGLKMRRQHPVGPFIVDFACVSLKLAIELDGTQHGDEAAIEYDAGRTAYLASSGWPVLRFWNREVVEDIDAVVYAIDGALKDRR